MIKKRSIIGRFPPWIVHRRKFSLLTTVEGLKFVDGTFFRRKLPLPAIELSSPQGTVLFTEALQAGTATCFFRLMEQLHTQNEPEYCGLATLVTVLNALNVDPHRRWKGNWRFYSEELLECCEPLSVIKSKGIDFDRLAGLAKCNGLKVEAKRASESSFEEFRQQVFQASKVASFSLVLAYCRQVLNQTGTGHYSPMGAYHEKSDHLLILDCARFKYRPHWVPTNLMFDAMMQIDPSTGKSRGYMKMSPEIIPGPPPAAHVLSWNLKGKQDLKESRIYLFNELSRISETSKTVKEFLKSACNKLEEILSVELSGHGCTSPLRRKRITDQLNMLPNWDDDGDENEQEEDGEKQRILERRALILLMRTDYLAKVLEKRPDLEKGVLEWLRKATGEELALEIAFSQEELKNLFFE